MSLLKDILILGGTHGVEPQSEYMARQIAKELNLKKNNSAKYENLFDYYEASINDKTIVLIPDLNRYGLKNNTRGNFKGVDLNRNMPASMCPTVSCGPSKLTCGGF